MTFDQHVAVVTGGASGIGAACAHAFAAAGATVVIADIDEPGGQAVAAACRRATPDSRFIRADVRIPDDVTGLFAQVAGELGRIDVVVNSAGITRATSLFDITPDHWDEVMQINTRGSFLCLKAAASVMRETGRGGSIVNISSIGGKGWPGASSLAYSASKGAVVIMTRRAAVELAPLGIRVNCICPGITDTPLYRRTIAAVADRRGVTTTEAHEDLVATVPLSRLTSPEEIAAGVLFLSSPASASTTGQSLNIDGGLVFD
ncbi:MAG TPA: SDR family NAD(P)-dependent oxidoreductase [Acidimicrobiales bacterium]|jgi:NAD(P)-dependent dehydrogenase (short-subunit alcohol dehydrogenase family)|nr:SDR family NAD(P)-dependent oxidoreductase [Acidimicrobiales bacterium]